MQITVIDGINFVVESFVDEGPLVDSIVGEVSPAAPTPSPPPPDAFVVVVGFKPI